MPAVTAATSADPGHLAGSRARRFAALALALAAPAAWAQGDPRAFALVEVDLGTRAGAASVQAEWRYRDARIVEAAFPAPGADPRAGGAPGSTWEIEPHAGGAAYDDSGWPVIAPDSLVQRRGGGRLCFGWYRLRFQVPEAIGEVPVAGRALEFEVVLDDYAEVWVDGRLPRYLGQRGGALVAGWNAPNRVLLTNRAFAGQAFTIAVFGSNGPLSDPPANYLWIRSAKLRLRQTPEWGEPLDLRWERLDPRLDAVVSPQATVEQVASGHIWLEGPAWDRAAGCLYFSDIPRNEVLRWTPGAGAATFLSPSGYSGEQPFPGAEPGSNGLAVDAEGRLWLCQHGDRRIARQTADGSLATVVDRHQGKRLNSPNDLLLAPNGDLWFTDPPFGLPRQFDDPARELPFAGIYRRTPDGELTVIADDLRGPNGLALSPDNRTLYVSDADPESPKWLRIALDERRQPVRREVLLDAAQWKGKRPGYPDGMKVDAAGNLFACGPGGLYVFHADGTLLGVLHTGLATSNCAFGEDPRTLFVTADHGVIALRW